MTEPLVSVVVPAYNAEAFVETSVGSVLAQSFRDFELIVVDDGSTDGTSSRVRAYGDRVRLLGQQNRGVSAARNRGIAYARGRLVAFLDADDAWKPTKLERQLEELWRRPECGLCYTAVCLADARMVELGAERRRDGRVRRSELLVFGNVVTGSASAVVCERELLLAAGAFDERMSLCADWDAWVRLAERTAFAYVDEPLVVYRRTGASMSADPRVLERDTVRLLQKAFSAPSPDSPLRSRAYGRQYRVLSGSYLRAGAYGSALRCLVRAVRHDPRQVLYALALPARIAKRSAGAPPRPLQP